MTSCPKKSLGQHFLTSEAAVEKIMQAANLSSKDIVLEIGPGTGVLTKKLLQTGARVIAIEKDEALAEKLAETFKNYTEKGTLVIYTADALDISAENIEEIGTKPYKIVANIPYYITGKLIRHILSSSHQPRSATLLIQKEVAERIVAKNNKESILSISVKAYGAPEYVSTVKAGSFNPAPKVDSAIIHVSGIHRKNFAAISESEFFAILKKGFSSKRKFLKNNLNISEQEMEKCGLNSNARAENATLKSWLCLAKKIST